MIRINKKFLKKKKKSIKNGKKFIWDWYLQDRTGKLASGAIANIVDIAGGCVVHVEGLPFNVSVDISISFLSTARPDVS